MEPISGESKTALTESSDVTQKPSWHRVHYQAVQTIVVVIFGAVIPVMLLVLAATGLLDLQTTLRTTTEEFVTTFKATQDSVSQASDPNSYVLAAFVFSEYSNRAVITTKTRLKIGVMQIGFAVMSVGVMFLLLGIKDGGLDATLGLSSLNFDFKTGSTGLAAFIVGALMAAGGGLLKNDYSTVGVPSFSAAGSAYSTAYFRSILHDCKMLPEDQIATCFVKSLE